MNWQYLLNDARKALVVAIAGLLATGEVVLSALDDNIVTSAEWKKIIAVFVFSVLTTATVHQVANSPKE